MPELFDRHISAKETANNMVRVQLVPLVDVVLCK